MSIATTETALSLAIARRSFSVRRKGYDKAEVEELLDHVASQVAVLADEAGAAVAREEATSGELARVRAELADARQQAEAERRRRTTVEADLERLVAELDAERSRDRFSDVGEEIANILRSAQQAADELRASARAEVDELRRETDELVESMLQQAEERLAAAAHETRRIVDDATAEGNRVMTEAASAAAHMRKVEDELRSGLETAAGWLLKAANEPLAELPPLATSEEPVDLR